VMDLIHLQYKSNKSLLMYPFSIPHIGKSNQNKWYIEFYYDIPYLLQPQYGGGKKKRFKKYTGYTLTDKGINTVNEKKREKLAEDLRADWEYSLKLLKYNPFKDELEEYIKANKPDTINLALEEQRKLTPCKVAFEDYLESRRRRRVEAKTITTYRRMVDWMNEYLEEKEMIDKPISDVRFIHISGALNKVSEKKAWAATTINKQMDFASTMFNWLTVEDYIDKNPAKGKFVPLRTSKSKHRWYDRETWKLVKEAIQKSSTPQLLHAFQFVYWILIRAKAELQSIKVGDIDMELRRVAFRKEWTKNRSDQFREYSDEFHQVLLEMGIDNLPKHWYIFGSGCVPGEIKAGANSYSRMWEPIRTSLNLSSDYTIYGIKHTRIIHLMMQGVDGYAISHLARHGDVKTTDAYKKDYDFTLNKLYKPEDLTI